MMGFEACLAILFMLVVFVLAIMRRRQTGCLDFAIRPATKGFVPQQAAQASAEPQSHRRKNAKPLRVRDAIIELASLVPQCGCRALSRVFNHSYLDPGVSVGKTCVSDILRDYRMNLPQHQRYLQNIHIACPICIVWGIDMTEHR